MKRKKIKIMHIVTTLNVGGLEILVLNLMRFINRDIFEPYICSLTPNGALESEFSNLGVPVYTVNKKDRVDISLTTKLIKLFRSKKVNIVHTHNITPFLYSAFGTKFFNKISLIHTVHSNVKQNNKRLLIAEKFLASFAYKIIADCDKVKDFLNNQQGITSKKVVTIYNGIDIRLYDQPIDVRKKHEQIGLSENDYIITCVANLIPVKNHKMLIHSFRQVVDAIPNTKLLLVGSGICQSELENLSKELGIFDKTIFLGRRWDVPEILKITDVFALSSLSEGLPLSVIEASASGIPVVVTDVGGNTEIVQNNVSGFVVNSGDTNGMAECIIRLLKDKEKALLFGNYGKKLVSEKFSIQRMVYNYEKIYLESIENR